MSGRASEEEEDVWRITVVVAEAAGELVTLSLLMCRTRRTVR